ncbi:hypothetical protein [Gilvimarinus polysaccharolyticus]|uniref:hypothetical protein n=1 Tax=Gilvimarinus polysaccharolyticus TaxID=863921 RepID=UPI0006738E73|nr:hypothetical protein [Gilvimarinus polysaccharolyticus]
MSFSSFLIENGWDKDSQSVKYSKGNWNLTYDTSAWIEVGTIRNPRVFDVPVPEKDKEQWTLNLIVHLCEADDKIHSK